MTQARNLVEDIEWSAMDATRTPIDYLCRCVEAAIKAGATTINLPDTVGYAVPDQYAEMFAHVRKHARGADRVVLSAHCHNDLGMAVGNSLAAVRADPLREASHAILIRAHLAAGNRGEALRDLDRYERHLHDDLGLKPTPELRQLVAELIRARR